MNTHIALIGAGRVGTTIAYTLIIQNLASHITLIDIDTNRCEGEVRDLSDTLAFNPIEKISSGTFEDARSADIIIIAAGKAQLPSESRKDLLSANKKIIEHIINNLEPIKPDALILIITNPVDSITTIAQRMSSLNKSRIIGTGTWLDTQRLRRYLAQELAIAPESINASIIGEHGESQCVAWSQTHISGIPIKKLALSKDLRKKLAEKAKNEAHEIIQRKCATFYGIASAVTDICQSIIFDQKKILPLSTFIPEFDLCLSLPVILGKNGVERVLPLELNENELICLKKSAESIKKTITETIVT